MHQAPKPGPDPERPTHIVFVGAGAVGCFYASRLHFPNHNIHTSLIARSNYKALAQDGVKLQTHSFGEYTFIPHAVYPSISAAAASPPSTSKTAPSSTKAPEWDYVIVTTKALPDRTNDAELIAPLVGPNTCIVLIQNGVGVEAPYRARFPDTPIISAVTVVSAEQTKPGTIRQNRWTRIHLGPYSNSASFSPSPAAPGSGGDETTGNITPVNTAPPPSILKSRTAPQTPQDLKDAALANLGLARANQLGDWWTRLGLIRDVELSDEIDLQIIRWHKLCINAAFNPSAVLAGGVGNADMARDPELRVHLAGVMREIWEAVPLILGRGFPEGLASPERILRSSERNVGSKPSMLLDWEAGRAMELEVILGNPVRIARARGVEMGRLQSLYALLRSAQGVREGEKKGGREKGRL